MLVPLAAYFLLTTIFWHVNVLITPEDQRHAVRSENVRYPFVYQVTDYYVKDTDAPKVPDSSVLIENPIKSVRTRSIKRIGGWIEYGRDCYSAIDRKPKGDSQTLQELIDEIKAKGKCRIASYSYNYSSRTFITFEGLYAYMKSDVLGIKDEKPILFMALIVSVLMYLGMVNALFNKMIKLWRWIEKGS